MNRRLFLSLLLPVALLAAPASADEPSGREIMEQADRRQKPKDEFAQVKIALFTDANSAPRRMELETWFLADPEASDDKMLMTFTGPSYIAKTALLTHEKTESEDDQWVYIAAMKKTKRIAGASKTQNFAGTNYTYEDLRTEDLARHDYKLLRTEELAGHPCYVVAATPATESKKEETGYSKRLLWVEKDRLITWKAELYDKKDRLHKVLLQTDWQQDEKTKKWRCNRSRMSDKVRGGYTDMIFEERVLDEGIDEGVFDVGRLGR